ncbi:MAG: hypothetical protein JF592_19115 [Microbacterium sp.]|nr:hypothetical protein [Microbacterium sp.]
MAKTPRPATAVDLTVEQQALLVEGVDAWQTNSIADQGVRRLFITDGPHGVRKVRSSAGSFAIGDNETSTAFPPAVTVASSWNPDNAHAMGEAIGREARAAGVDVILGPGVSTTPRTRWSRVCSAVPSCAASNRSASGPR